jgi:hypothetical protein
MLYARAITLRNCGRFTVIASDFGSDYRTHTHVTSEALYAALTRGATWRPRLIDLRNDPDTFTLAYDVAAMPIWFLPGIFMADGSPRLPDAYLDTTAFNVVHEFYPSTSLSYVLGNDGLEAKARPYYVPTYGTVQAVKPNQRMVTYAFSPQQDLLQRFAQGQTFVLGKKRTMFQVVELSDIVRGVWKQGSCATTWLELPPHGARHFQSFEVLAATMRYIILRGRTRGGAFVEFHLGESSLCLPDRYLAETPLPGAWMTASRH